jgi:hypothetical protein
MNETTSAKKLIPFALVLGLAVALAGCSTNSPTAPKTQPTPGAATVTLTASQSSATVGFAVQLSAHVTRGSSAVADGTSVTFVITGCSSTATLDPSSTATPYFENLQCQITKSTTGGTAVATMGSTLAATFEVRAVVPNAEGSTNVTFTRVTGPYTPTVSPLVYSVSPNQGYSQGGDQVTITGTYLCSTYNVSLQGVVSCLTPGIVTFSSPAGQHPAQVTSYTSGSVYDQLVVTVPAASVDALGADFNADVTVNNGSGTNTLGAAYKYLADQPTPQIYALSPASGPATGGTRVTLTGNGFQNPVQVAFVLKPPAVSANATVQAQVVSVNFSQIVLVTPDLSPYGPTTPAVADVRVTNVNSGKNTTLSGGFQFGSSLFISSLSPNEGPANQITPVTIYGQGFSSPVQVTINVAGGLTAQVLSVAGTQIQANFPAVPTNARSCGDASGAVTVTNVASNQSVTGPNFTYRAVHPLISSVVVNDSPLNLANYVGQPGTSCSDGTVTHGPWTAHTVTINGSGFVQRTNGQSAMVVSFNGIGPVQTTWVNSTQLTAQLPDLTGVTINQISCTTGGACGQQYIDTPVSVMVMDQDNGCSDTLSNGLVIRPCDTSCRLATVSSITLTGPTTTQTVGAPFLVTVTVAPVNPTETTTISLSYDPAFNGPGSVSIPPNQTTSVISVTPTSAVSGGQILASAGSGTCAVYATPLLVTAQATLNVALTLNDGAAGSVVSTNPAGINCGSTCSAQFTVRSVFLTATASTGHFTGWDGTTACGSCGSNPTNCEVQLDAASVQCTAIFDNP